MRKRKPQPRSPERLARQHIGRRDSAELEFRTGLPSELFQALKAGKVSLDRKDWEALLAHLNGDLVSPMHRLVQLVVGKQRSREYFLPRVRTACAFLKACPEVLQPELSNELLSASTLLSCLNDMHQAGFWVGVLLARIHKEAPEYDHLLFGDDQEIIELLDKFSETSAYNIKADLDKRPALSERHVELPERRHYDTDPEVRAAFVQRLQDAGLDS